jgi:hypothetical protein
MWIRDRLDGLFSDEDFTAWYPRDGRPGLAPAQPATGPACSRGAPPAPVDHFHKL